MIIPIYTGIKNKKFLNFIDLKIDLIELALEFNESEIYRNANYQSQLVMDKLMGE